jgi:hypothetical protein
VKSKTIKKNVVPKVKYNEVRLDMDGEFDELVVTDAFVHIERMSSTGFWMAVTPREGMPYALRFGFEEGVFYVRLNEEIPAAAGGKIWLVEVPIKKKHFRKKRKT